MDKGRTPTNVLALANNNISYFLNLDASTNGNSILTGDRFLEIAGKPINSGVFLQKSNLKLQWSDGYHLGYGKPLGYFSFADGHAQSVRQKDLNLILRKQPLATNRFCIP